MRARALSGDNGSADSVGNGDGDDGGGREHERERDRRIPRAREHSLGGVHDPERPDR